METLASWIAREGRLAEADAVGWVVRLAKALEPIHLLGIAHGRLSSEAILAAGPGCREKGAVVGTKELSDDVAYHGPERARGVAGKPESDTWAATVILYEALTGTLPFVAKNDQSLLAKLTGLGPAPLSRFDIKNDELQKVIDRAFAFSKQSRLTNLRQLRDALVASFPDAGELEALQLGAEQTAVEVDDEVYDAETKKLDDVTALTRFALIKKGAIPAAPGDLLYDAPAAETATKGAGVAESAPGAEPPLAEDEGDEEDDEEDLAATRLMEGDEADYVAERIRAAERSLLVDDDEDDEGETRLIDPVAPLPAAKPATAERAADKAAKLSGDLPKAGRIIDFGDLLAEQQAEDEAEADASSESDVVDAAALEKAAAPPQQAAAAPQAARPVEAPTPSPAVRRATPTDGVAPLLPLQAVAKPQPVQARDETELGARAVSRAAEPLPRQPEVAAPPPERAEPAKRARRKRGPIRTLMRLLLLAAVGAAVALLVFRPDARRDFVLWVHRHTGYWIPLPGVTRPEASPSAGQPKASRDPTAGAGGAVASAAPSSAAGGEAASPTGQTTANPAPTASSTVDGATGPASAAASATASATAHAKAASPAEVEACVVGLFPLDTFAATEPDFRFLCTETNPRKGASALKTQIVLAGGDGVTTTAMQEWALLGWYEMAAFTAVRARCCSDAPALKTPESLAHCKLDDALAAVGAAAVKADDAAVRDAVRAYATALSCLYQVGASSVFGLSGPSRGGEASAFQKLLVRVRQSGSP